MLLTRLRDDPRTRWSRAVRVLAFVLAVAVTGLAVALTPTAPAQAAVVQWGTNNGTAPNYQATVNGDFVVAGNG
ncbi:MAG: hypothetical protein HY996_00260, partial [Micrococcales bacterium]|nr:hypothetical protein [Micrococcales bacterium]